MKPKIEFLEVMVIRTCNLSCQGCTTFSDLTYSGYTTWEQARAELEPWTHRLDIEAIGIMGGEPLINPDIKNWLTGIRELLPNAQIRFITNGLLLNRHWDVVELLQELGNTVLKISYHINNAEVDSVIQRIFQTWPWTPVNEFGIDRWGRERECKFQVARPTQFLKTFKNDYANMAPHDSDPVEAFQRCVQKRCPLLYRGQLFKCGTVALMPEVLERHGNPNIEQWEPYLGHGLDITCSDRELRAFANNFGRPHPICQQCPTKNDTDSMLDHRITVVVK